MHLYQQLQRDTQPDREYLLAAPTIQRALAGDISRELYVEFLTQAYHHVRHTVPLLMAVGARLPQRHEWLRGGTALPRRREGPRAVDPERHRARGR